MNKKGIINPKEVRNQNYEPKKMNSSENLKKKKEKDLPWWVELLFVQKSFSLTNYQITQICKKEKRASTCIKNLREKRDNLEKGNLIKIPVIPYKNNQNLNFKFGFEKIKRILIL